MYSFSFYFLTMMMKTIYNDYNDIYENNHNVNNGNSDDNYNYNTIITT